MNTLVLVKTCSCCDETKDAVLFHKSAKAKDGLNSRCKECTAVRNKQWYNENKDKHKITCAKWYVKNKKSATRKGTEWHYMSRYGITHQQFLDLAFEQGNKCSICGIDLTFAEKCNTRAVLDHDHNSGEIRGVLCNSCNTALGLFKDSEHVLQNAIVYLKGHTV